MISSICVVRQNGRRRNFTRQNMRRAIFVLESGMMCRAHPGCASTAHRRIRLAARRLQRRARFSRPARVTKAGPRALRKHRRHRPRRSSANRDNPIVSSAPDPALPGNNTDPCRTRQASRCRRATRRSAHEGSPELRVPFIRPDCPTARRNDGTVDDFASAIGLAEQHATFSRRWRVQTNILGLHPTRRP